MVYLRRSPTLIGTFLLAVLAFSCNKPDERFKPVYPFRGKVLYEGNPPVGAVLSFEAVSGVDPWAKPNAKVDERGEFIVSTYRENDGVPAGNYDVIITWLPEGYTGPIEKGNKLPAKYAERTTSGLKAEVKKGENAPLFFNLTK